MVGAVVAFSLYGTPEAGVSESAVNMDLPDQIAGYVGTDQKVSESELAILPKDTEFAKKLYSDGSSEIHCQIVLAGAEKRSIHRPEVCLPGQGWTVKSGQVVPVKLADGRTLDVMQLTIGRPVTLPDGSKKELTSLFYYWFVGKGTTTPHHLVRILKTNMDMLLHNVNHRWAYVIVSSPVWEGFRPGGKNEAETRQQLTEFIGQLAPRILLEGPKPSA
ncbi:MAG: hypothetical protein Fur0032_06650 [Terrimicrobiaceae bacterium]